MHEACQPACESKLLDSRHLRERATAQQLCLARSLPACGHHILFVCWMTVAGNRARGDHQNRSLGWKIDFRLDEHWESRCKPKAQWESICPNFGRVTRHQKSLDLNSVLSSFTAPAVALAMCLRTASVVSSTRVLGRWNLRVAVDIRRQRLYRLRRVSSAA